MLTASVVIATRDRAARLGDCLNSLRVQTARGRFEVVVVDNGSSDGTAETLNAQRAGMPELRSVYVADPNRAKARNAGIAAARGEQIIFCDDDTVAPERFIAAHVAAHELHGRCAVAGPIVNVAEANATLVPSGRHYSRAYFCTCNASVAKADIEAVGGFDEQYDLYGWEDTDLGIRLRSLRLPRVFAWEAFIYHVKPPDATSFAQRRAQAIEKGTMAARFVRKAPSWPVKLATGAYSANFFRAALMSPAPLRRLFERAARPEAGHSALKSFATEALLDAAYVDALKTALRSTHA